MNNEHFKKMYQQIESTSDEHTKELDSLSEEIDNSLLQIPDKIILNGFINAKKEYAAIKGISSGSGHAFNIGAQRLDVFRNYFDQL